MRKIEKKKKKVKSVTSETSGAACTSPANRKTQKLSDNVRKTAISLNGVGNTLGK